MKCNFKELKCLTRLFDETSHLKFKLQGTPPAGISY